MNGNEEDILTLLTRHELALKDLYEALASFDEARSAFWAEIARDEAQHAAWLADLRADAATADWFKVSCPLKPPAIKLSIGYVEGQAAKVRQRQFDLTHAFTIVKDIENALIERQFSKMEDVAPETIKIVLDRLAIETEKHLRMIVERMNAEQH